jgi:uncharacterized protein with HEPN domain
MNTRARKLLQDVCDAGARISRFTLGKTRDDYAGDELLRSAVERQLLIVGEATSRLAHEDASAAAELGPIRSVVAFRNILVHAYFQVKDDVVWEIVQRDLPPLVAKAAEMLKKP